jgi:hypothetical protein
MPAVFQMGLNYAKWLYLINDDVLTVEVIINEATAKVTLNVKSENGVDYEYLYVVDQTDISASVPFTREAAPLFWAEWDEVLETGDDAAIEEFIMNMYEQDIYRMYMLKCAEDHKYCNRYDFIKMMDNSVQPETVFPNWKNCPCTSVSSWNWDEDAGFVLDAIPTSKMTLAFMKVKEEYRGKF